MTDTSAVVSQRVTADTITSQRSAEASLTKPACHNNLYLTDELLIYQSVVVKQQERGGEIF
jgi:hypothetical protein